MPNWSIFSNLRKHSSKSLSQPTIPEEGPEHEEVGAFTAAPPSFTSKILAAVSGKTVTATDRSQAVKTPPTGTKVNLPQKHHTKRIAKKSFLPIQTFEN